DAGLEEKTGKDSGGLVLAALFGSDSDKDKTVQLADATNSNIAPSSLTLASAATTLSSGSVASIEAQNPVSQNIEIAQSASIAPVSAAFEATVSDQETAMQTPMLPTSEMLMAQAEKAATITTLPASVPNVKAASNVSAAGGISLANAKINNKQ